MSENRAEGRNSGGGRPRRNERPREEESSLIEKTVFVNRVAKVVKGGRRFNFSALVVVGVEKLSDWVNHEDRGTAFLFADGAGAVVIGPSDVPAIGPVVWGADGDQR